MAFAYRFHLRTLMPLMHMNENKKSINLITVNVFSPWKSCELF